MCCSVYPQWNKEQFAGLKFQIKEELYEQRFSSAAWSPSPVRVMGSGPAARSSSRLAQVQPESSCTETQFVCFCHQSGPAASVTAEGWHFTLSGHWPEAFTKITPNATLLFYPIRHEDKSWCPQQGPVRLLLTCSRGQTWIKKGERDFPPQSAKRTFNPVVTSQNPCSKQIPCCFVLNKSEFPTKKTWGSVFLLCILGPGASVRWFG